MDDLISRETVRETLQMYVPGFKWDTIDKIVDMMPSAQPELIEKAAYIRGFEQGRTQGMIDTKAEEVTQTNLQPTCNQLATGTISRQAAIDAVEKNKFRLTFAEEQNCEGHVAWSANVVYSDVIEGKLLELPSAQPEIIRCGECTHKDKKIDYCHYLGITICEHDFCSYGERRTDETTI